MELRCQRKGSVSHGLGADFSLPHCLVGDEVSESSAEPSPAGISEPRGPKSHGTSSWYNAQAKCPEIPLSAVFFSLFEAGKSPEDIIEKKAFYSCPLSCPCQIVDGYS